MIGSTHRTVAVLLAGLLAACAGDAGPERGDPASGGPDIARASPPAARVVSHPPALLPAIPDTAFARMVRTLSEPGGYFDTDNLISNEASYLHIVGDLEARGIRGGVYLGVGPGQNFSYIAAVRPELAFVVDIRRDNLLQHLWFKALFERAESRLDYLCLMVARSCGGPRAGEGVRALVRQVDAASPVDTIDALVEAVVEHAASAGVPLTEDDRGTLRSIHRRFAAAGLDLRFNSHGRAPRSDYPTLRRLILERDRNGAHASYLADEADYRFVRGLQRGNRVVPVVGDLAGGHAVRAIGREARRRGLPVKVLYTSNVEFYLFGDGSFHHWMDNLGALPVTDDAVVIRSYFNRFRPIPQTVPGYASTQLLQTVPALLAAWEEGRIGSYRALVVQ